MRSNLKQLGFTLVELVVVIIILAIISLYASSKYIGVNNFSSFAAQEQAISVIRQVQLGRMQSNTISGAASSEYRLQVTSDCLGAMSVCSGSSNASERSNAVWITDQSFQFGPAGMIIDFDLKGNPSCVACTVPTPPYHRIEISNTGVCINEQGFVYGC